MLQAKYYLVLTVFQWYATMSHSLAGLSVISFELLMRDIDMRDQPRVSLAVRVAVQGDVV